MTTEEHGEKRELGHANVNRIDLVDAQGRMRAMVSVGNDGPRLWLFDESETLVPRAVLAVTKDGPVQVLVGDKCEVAAPLTVCIDAIYLNLRDTLSELQEHVSANDGPPLLELRGAGGGIQAVISVNAANLMIMLHDAEGNLRASVAMGNKGGHLRLFDENRNTIWQAP